jgi:hypothetical protein
MALVLAAIVILGGGWYYWFSSTQGQKVAEALPAAAIQTIIPYSKVATVVVDPSSNPLELIGSKLAALNAGLGNISAIIPVSSATANAQSPIADILGGTAIPNRLERSLGGQYMIGAYTYDTQNSFIILKDTFYQNAYAGMLDWEKDMRNDLLPLIRVAHPDVVAISVNSDSFSDTVVSNIDTRVLKDASGDVILAYAFASNDTIVITTGIDSMKYLLDRLLAVRTIQ